LSNRRNPPALPRRKHLRRLDRITIRGPLVFFLTVCVAHRRPVLADPRIADILVQAWRHATSLHGWLIGRYVIMPDHVHFFASPLGEVAKNLSGFLKYWKRSTAIRLRKAGLGQFRWQREFFDHLLRNEESYAEKWEYVRHNPVRAGLVSDPSEWPYQGEIAALEW
jgi:REP element-mobilizing transposase RayT